MDVDAHDAVKLVSPRLREAQSAGVIHRRAAAKVADYAFG
jgi:hypothetical protein